jgi:membrane-bound lytic murein transglycosylase B
MKLFASRLFPIAAALLAASASAAVDMEAVERAKREFVERMVTKHAFSAAEVEEILSGVEINEQILETIARPAERVVPWHEYRNIFLTPERIAAGVEFWNAHAAQIEAASERFGVAPEIVVAIIGVETYFGRRMGNYRVLDALSTLAFAYPPRASFFASELEAFLLLGRDEGLGLFEQLGSYAGAMGAGQFIPSSFRAYAVDGDGDGLRDLWTNWDDILASVANYFKVHGWRDGELVADPVSLGDAWSGHEPESAMDLNYTVGELRRLGYVLPAERGDDVPATILALEGEGGTTEYWVGYHNFRVITRYNRSVKYALAAHQLSRAIADEYELGAGGE